MRTDWGAGFRMTALPAAMAIVAVAAVAGATAMATAGIVATAEIAATGSTVATAANATVTRMLYRRAARSQPSTGATTRGAENIRPTIWTIWRRPVWRRRLAFGASTAG